MDMKTAGACLVAFVVQLDRTGQYAGPGHFSLMIGQCHGMGHKLKAVVQGTIMLTVHPLCTIEICLLQNGLGMAVVFSAIVDLQFNSKESCAFPVKNRLRFIIIVLDHSDPGALSITACAKGLFFVYVIGVIPGVFQPEKSPAADAVCVVTIVAALTKRSAAVSFAVI